MRRIAALILLMSLTFPGAGYIICACSDAVSNVASSNLQASCIDHCEGAITDSLQHAVDDAQCVDLFFSSPVIVRPTRSDLSAVPQPAMLAASSPPGVSVPILDARQSSRPHLVNAPPASSLRTTVLLI